MRIPLRCPPVRLPRSAGARARSPAAAAFSSLLVPDFAPGQLHVVGALARTEPATCPPGTAGAIDRPQPTLRGPRMAGPGQRLALLRAEHRAGPQARAALRLRVQPRPCSWLAEGPALCSQIPPPRLLAASTALPTTISFHFFAPSGLYFLCRPAWDSHTSHSKPFANARAFFLRCPAPSTSCPCGAWAATWVTAHCPSPSSYFPESGRGNSPWGAARAGATGSGDARDYGTQAALAASARRGWCSVRSSGSSSGPGLASKRPAASSRPGARASRRVTVGLGLRGDPAQWLSGALLLSPLARMGPPTGFPGLALLGSCPTHPPLNSPPHRLPAAPAEGTEGQGGARARQDRSQTVPSPLARDPEVAQLLNGLPFFGGLFVSILAPCCFFLHDVLQ